MPTSVRLAQLPQTNNSPQKCNMSSAPSSTSAAPARMQVIKGVSEIHERYNTILLDQFGVIHDGRKAYPAALEAIKKLHACGKKIMILSNSSKQAGHALKRLGSMGVDTRCIERVVTSGEVALRVVGEYMRKREKCCVLHFNWRSERGTIDLFAHGVTNVAKLSRRGDGKVAMGGIDEIDVIIAHGTDGLTVADGSVETYGYEALEDICVQVAQNGKNVPFFCANPDVVTVDGGELRTMPGSLGRAYEGAGGKVVWLGKPDKVVYDEILSDVDADGGGRERVLAIGDSVGHDILGATEGGVDSMYIAGGINAEEFGLKGSAADEKEGFQWDEGVFEDIVKQEAMGLGLRRPTYVLDYLRW